MLLLLMGLYALGNLATAITPTFGSLMAFRLISGLPKAPTSASPPW